MTLEDSDIVVTVRGGCIEDVYGPPGHRVIIVDWDDVRFNDGGDPGRMVYDEADCRITDLDAESELRQTLEEWV